MGGTLFVFLLRDRGIAFMAAILLRTSYSECMSLSVFVLWLV